MGILLTYHDRRDNGIVREVPRDRSGAPGQAKLLILELERRYWLSVWSVDIPPRRANS
jgi:hypothetical protein